jgi:hypothetical protein
VIIDGGEILEANVHVEDPGAFTMPWDAIQRYRRVEQLMTRKNVASLAALATPEDGPLTEAICAENPNSFMGMPHDSLAFALGCAPPQDGMASAARRDSSKGSAPGEMPPLSSPGEMMQPSAAKTASWTRRVPKNPSRFRPFLNAVFDFSTQPWNQSVRFAAR